MFAERGPEAADQRSRIARGSGAQDQRRDVLAAAQIVSQRARRLALLDGDAGFDPALVERRRYEVEGYRAGCEESFKRYRDLLDAGWPRELARSVLPVSTYSHMFATVNLRNLLHFLDLRCDAHAQHEIRVYADAMLTLSKTVAPIALEAWGRL